jgi:hypothetical protein
MNELIIKGTNKTPEVKMDPASGTVEISGKSIPENSLEFYQPLFNWVDEYVANPADKTEVRIVLEYFNTTSSKCLLDIFRKMESLSNSGRSQVSVLWHYEEDDEDMMEAGQDYDALVKIPFTLVKI